MSALRRLPASAALVAACLLAACSSSVKRPDPTPLQSFEPKLQAPLAWSQRMSGIPAPLSLTVTSDAVVAVDRDGNVESRALGNGASLWRGAVNERVTAGVGSDGRYAAVVTRQNELVALDRGAVKWRKTLPTRVVTAPLVAGERVFVLGIDRVVRAFDAQDGRALWTQQRPGDALSLSQASVVVPFKDTLLVGQGSRLAGLDPTSGMVRWDVPISSPRGTNEVERLADLVAPAARVGDIVCARSYQITVSCANAERGVLVWTRNVGGDEGVAADTQYVYGADASDRLTAWNLSDGNVAWTSAALAYRNLSAPAVTPDALILGDAQGMVHFLARDSGQTLQRVATDGSAIDAPPVVAGKMLIVATRNGGLFAYKLP